MARTLTPMLFCLFARVLPGLRLCFSQIPPGTPCAYGMSVVPKARWPAWWKRGSVVWQSAMTAGSSAVGLSVDRWAPGTYLLHFAAPNGWSEECGL